MHLRDINYLKCITNLYKKVEAQSDRRRSAEKWIRRNETTNGSDGAGNRQRQRCLKMIEVVGVRSVNHIRPDGRKVHAEVSSTDGMQQVY